MVGSPAGDAYGDIDAQIRDAQERAEHSGAWAAQVQELTGYGTALRGGVTVEVDQSGTVVRLGISDAAAGYGGQMVAQAVLQANTQAQEELRRRVEESTSAMFGAASPTTTAVVEEVERQTPAADREPPPSTPSARGGAW
ncbi:YbaB/EbfC family nucleoid-associated protein [Phycicoccus duodecadis]|uniref:YbaB/EbfC DNA-binding family protein n=1 Tax=Phycicoccus duodecadis TaxID=173053 RepID=A0A2N3YGJ0_9MICO|nr:YbaB/EbfC family nucleoid-associated protein [Phycicoccus duodecadis]PKW25959.1 YbaB/EbfC DNA-binding family protein [Phycicoccus duodecadis]